ncbi:hypothetical protein SDC9_193252 [bioreactor metagenome]|uniref:Uncharacterized protein n=1 Tax=bioreactor metagenome TaxID=1076179 RepID=A0A645IE51_9ZZZZ
MHGFHHHDGIIHHNGYGQHQSEERQQVDAETKYRKEEERTHQ